MSMAVGTDLVRGEALSQRYGAAVALHETSIGIARGEIVAIVGPNGCGKSTLLRALAGIAQGGGSGGRVGYEGAAEREGLGLARVRSFVPQRPAVEADFTVREVVRLGRFARGDDEGAVSRAIAAVGLSARAERPVHTLSGGERQRVAVARALAQVDGAATPVLLLDEPFSGIDPGEVARIVRVLRALAGVGAVVLSLHDPGLARALATRGILMREGRVLADGPCERTIEPTQLTKAYGHPIVVHSGWLGPLLGMEGAGSAL